MTPLQRQLEIQPSEEKYRMLSYRLANALMDEVHYSQKPSENTLTLLAEALAMFPDSHFAKLYEEFGIAKMEPVE